MRYKVVLPLVRFVAAALAMGSCQFSMDLNQYEFKAEAMPGREDGGVLQPSVGGLAGAGSEGADVTGSGETDAGKPSNDGATMWTGGTSQSDGATPVDAGPVSECQRDADCALPRTEPAGCAEAKCQDGNCILFARDADRDGERSRCNSIEEWASVSSGLDCDDFDVDENTQHPEQCDGKDNDCNGEIDDRVPASDIPCSTELAGVCEGHGYYECQDGQYSRCNAQPVAQPGPADLEECDGIDRNCNGNDDTAGCPCVFGEQFACTQTCGPSVVLSCPESGELPSCDPGPPKQTYCSDLDGDGFLGQCAPFCPGDVPAGWRLDSSFASLTPDCSDTEAIRSPALAEVCDGVDNNCSAGTADEPNRSCSGCGSVACSANCPAVCPSGYAPTPDGMCESEEYQSYHEDRQVCAPFPCVGLRLDDVPFGGPCLSGQTRANVSVFALSRPDGQPSLGNCSGEFATSDETDCSLKVHFGAAWCDCFVCSLTVTSRIRVPQCQ